jgi:hypothetical protein
MSQPFLIPCDGCGQPASSEHIAQRLLRLEWATRYRPIHLNTLLLGAVSPAGQSDFLYSPDEGHGGEAAQLLGAAGINTTNKTAEAIGSEFQRLGLYLTHILECPAIPGASSQVIADAINSRLPLIFTRIRRSLKPKRLVLFGEISVPSIEQFAAAQLGCELILDDGKPFTLGDSLNVTGQSMERLRAALSSPQSATKAGS